VSTSCDYRVALTSGSKLINPNTVSRDSVASVEHLKSERKKISYALSQKDKDRLLAQTQKAEPFVVEKALKKH
jgi:hypothetical protein